MSDLLQARLASGEYPPRSRLPTEKALADELGVTRLTVREALSRLAAKGFIRTRHGSGTEVRDLAGASTFATMTELVRVGRALSDAELRSLVELRAVLFRAFGEHLLARASEADIDALRAILAREIRAGDAGEERRARAELDYDFDLRLAHTTRNDFLALLVRSMRELHLRLGAEVHRATGDDALILATQRALVDALAQKDARRLAKQLERYFGGAATALGTNGRAKAADEHGR